MQKMHTCVVGYRKNRLWEQQWKNTKAKADAGF